MKINIHNIDEHGSIKSAIEALAAADDSIASGIIGPSYSCPGSGWSREYDTSDYAFRALDGEYGATSYIDSDDGREATMEDIQTVVWTDESVVEIILPTVKECLEYPDAWAHLADHGAHYGADQDALDDLAEKVAEPYRISDGNAVEYAATLADAMEIVEGWYDYLLDEDKLDSLPALTWPWEAEVDDLAAIDAINRTIRLWENEIAESMGAEDWAGHGSYYVSAADRAGLNLSVSIRE